ncbi:MAG TPA: serine hydrolase, partial [Flavipsychrobacter sp.]
MRYTKPICTAILAIIASWCTLSCNETTENVSAPQQLNDGWEISTPEKEGMDAALLAKAIEQNAGNKKVDGFVVVRNGRLVAEAYYNGYDADTPHKVWSVTKSVVSAIIGIAIEEDKIASEQDSIGKYLGAYQMVMGKNKNGITIEHLLTMTSGIEWVELGGRQSAGFRVAYSPDWVEFVLSQPIKEKPGAGFNYSSGDYMLLAPIIKNATGRQADAYA